MAERYFNTQPCILCGEIHSLHVHSRRKRIVRYDSEGSHERSDIIRLICYTAQKAKKQYTVTILPHFLLPGCLVRADDVYTMGSEDAIRSDITKMCETLGVVDERTARKHLARFYECCRAHCVRLSSALAVAGEDLPVIKPRESTEAELFLRWFRLLSKGIIKHREKYRGYENLSIADSAFLYMFFIHPAYPCTTVGAMRHDPAFDFF